jgi:hypothetical protein
MLWPLFTYQETPTAIPLGIANIYVINQQSLLIPSQLVEFTEYAPTCLLRDWLQYCHFG